MNIPEWFKPGVMVRIVDDTCHHLIPVGTTVELTRSNSGGGIYTNYPNYSYVTPRDVIPATPKTLEELL